MAIWSEIWEIFKIQHWQDSVKLLAKLINSKSGDLDHSLNLSFHDRRKLLPFGKVSKNMGEGVG